MQSPDGSSLELSLEPAVNLAVGVSGYKSTPRQYMHDDLVDLVTGGGGSSNRAHRMPQSSSTGVSSQGIKMEPLGECRGD